jgi:ankyrin repeat protein
MKSKYGWTALICAAFHRHSEVVKVLLEKGANPTLKSANGDTAFDIALRRGYKEVTKLLELVELNSAKISNT